MLGSRLRKIAIVAAAGGAATVGTLALNPFSASAAAPSTTTTVTGPATVPTGHGATFTATISPSKTTTKPVVKATGAVSFTILDSSANPVSCSNVPVLSGSGKFTCKVAAGSLLASASPYSVEASYAGDGGTNFGPSNATVSLAVTAAAPHVRLTVDAKPTVGSASTFTATVTGGGGILPTGMVEFAVVGNKTTCSPTAKNNEEGLSPNSGSPPVAQAVCSLPTTWLKSTKAIPSPHWTVVVTYLGDGNFAKGATARMNGTAK